MTTLNAIWDRIDDATISVNSEYRQSELEAAIRELQRLIDSGDARAWYPMGYAYYFHPNRRACGSLEAARMIDCLSAAIDRGIEPTLSHLFLCCHFFDMKDLAGAKHHADSVVEGDLAEDMAIKLREMKLCITILEEGLENSISAIQSFAQYISGLSEPAIPPLTLMNTIESEASGKNISRRVGEALRCLDAAFPILGDDGFSRLVNESNFEMPDETDKPAHDRASLKFTGAVSKFLRPVLLNYGFVQIEENLDFVRFDSPSVQVTLWHEPISYELDLVVCKNDCADRRFSLLDIVEAAGGTESTFFQASSVDRVFQCMQSIAQLLQKYGSTVLKGDPVTFDRVAAVSDRRNQEYTAGFVQGPIREAAELAWKEKRFQDVKRLYESIADNLTPIEQKRLAYATGDSPGALDSG